ncbi:hypothetical protein [Blautia sp. LMAG:89]|nr:hypothetical protein [Blautia sp. LMAG:89]
MDVRADRIPVSLQSGLHAVLPAPVPDPERTVLKAEKITGFMWSVQEL